MKTSKSIALHLALMACGLTNATTSAYSQSVPPLRMQQFVLGCAQMRYADQWESFARCFDEDELKRYQEIYVGAMDRDEGLRDRCAAIQLGRASLDQLRTMTPAKFFGTISRSNMELAFAREPLNKYSKSIGVEVSSATPSGDGTFVVTVTSAHRRLDAKNGDPIQNIRLADKVSVEPRGNSFVFRMPKSTFEFGK